MKFFHFFKTWFVFEFLLSQLLSVTGRGIVLRTSGEVGLYVTLLVGSFVERSLAVWCFILSLTTTCHSPFPATTQAAVKGFSKALVGMHITGETKREDSTKGIFAMAGPRTTEAFFSGQ